MIAIKNLLNKIFEGVSVSTIVRTACFFLALANQILQAMGKSPLPISDEQLNALITTGLTVITGLIAWYKNNSFTKAAQIGDEAMQTARLKGITK